MNKKQPNATNAILTDERNIRTSPTMRPPPIKEMLKAKENASARLPHTGPHALGTGVEESEQDEGNEY